MTDSLQGKLVVVTGGARGIGKEIALACAKNRAHVLITARSEGELKTAAQEITAQTGSPCFPLVCDASRAEDSKVLLEAIRKIEVPLYGLICAAGIYGAIGAFADTPFEEWEKAIDINLKGTARTIHALLPLMKKAGGGRIVLFSGGGQASMPNFSSYVTSKGGIWRLTETLAAEFKDSNIYLNSIAPGAVNTRLLDELLSAGPEKVGPEVYKKSLQQKDRGGESADKAAHLCLYLLSDRSKGLFGKTLSAVWDDYLNFENLDEMSRSDLYCVRRVVNSSGGTRGT